MKTALVRIGNSRGIRIPKPLIEQCSLGNTVKLRLENERIIISPQHPPREGWVKQLQSARTSVADELLLDIGTGKFEKNEWRW